MLGYIWISKREWARHQRELNAAFKRASEAEQQLAAERQAKDWLVLQLASRVITKHGGYGLDHEPRVTTETAQAKPAGGFIREPTLDDEDRLDYYKKCYREKGLSEDAAVSVWEAEMRGETPKYPYEEAEMEQ